MAYDGPDALEPTPAELATLRATLESTPSIHARLIRSGEAGLDPAGWDDATLTRWLVAEGGDAKAAAARLEAHAAWRASVLPDGWTAEKESAIAAELAQGKTFAAPPAPTASPARPLLLSLSARHFRARRSPADVGELSLIYAMDALAAAASASARPAAPGPRGDGRVVSIVDMRGVGLGNLDGETSKAVVRVAQAAYPERLAATVIYGAPAIFGAIWSVLGRLLAPASLGKVFFFKDGGDWGSVGLDPSAVPACLGGRGGDAVRAVPIQAFARSVGLGPKGAAVVPLEEGLAAVAGDPLVVGGKAESGVEGGGVVVAARAG